MTHTSFIEFTWKLATQAAIAYFRPIIAFPSWLFSFHSQRTGKYNHTIASQRRPLILGFAAIGAAVALIPGGSFILIPLELGMLYSIADRHGKVELLQFTAMSIGVTAMSLFLKGLTSFLNAMPVMGQIANSLIAFAFIAVIGLLAERYYSEKTRR